MLGKLQQHLVFFNAVLQLIVATASGLLAMMPCLLNGQVEMMKLLVWRKKRRGKHAFWKREPCEVYYNVNT